MKQLTLTISPDMWEAYKEAVSIRQGVDVSEEQAEEIAKNGYVERHAKHDQHHKAS